MTAANERQYCEASLDGRVALTRALRARRWFRDVTLGTNSGRRTGADGLSSEELGEMDRRLEKREADAWQKYQRDRDTGFSARCALESP